MKLYGVIGDQRARRSLSPRMHNAVLAAHGIQGAYGVFPVEPGDLPRAINGLRALGIAGANVTVPHKQAAAGLLDELSQEAEVLGAVNTIVNTGDRLAGHNTDVGGFAGALAAAGFDPAGRPAIVLGAGGAARAVVRALDLAGASPLLVAGRTLDKARALTEDLGGRALELSRAGDAVAAAELVVNATSVSDPAEGPELAARVKGWTEGRSLAVRLVADLNYGRKQSMWADLAAAAGADLQDGLVMLAHQAALSFALWTGVHAPAGEFLEALRD